MEHVPNKSLPKIKRLKARDYTTRKKKSKDKRIFV